jgi:Lrp/AsnC family transcriptional regulator for asnA, asnC and gidA
VFRPDRCFDQVCIEPCGGCTCPWARSIAPMAEQFTIEKIDADILRLLQADGRRPFREIARELGISEGTVRTRVKRMQGSEALRFLAMVDPSALGHTVLFTVMVNLAAGFHDSVVEQLVAFPQIGYVATTFGRWDLILEVLAHSNEEAWSFITHQVRPLEGVEAVEPMPLLKVHKYKYEPHYI